MPPPPVCAPWLPPRGTRAPASLPRFPHHLAVQPRGPRAVPRRPGGPVALTSGPAISPCPVPDHFLRRGGVGGVAPALPPSCASGFAPCPPAGLPPGRAPPKSPLPPAGLGVSGCRRKPSRFGRFYSTARMLGTALSPGHVAQGTPADAVVGSPRSGAGSHRELGGECMRVHTLAGSLAKPAQADQWWRGGGQGGPRRQKPSGSQAQPQKNGKRGLKPMHGHACSRQL